MNYSTSDYLTQLQNDRETLVDNLETMGITGLTGDETFTELVPEVLNIEGGTPTEYVVANNYQATILESAWNYKSVLLNFADDTYDVDTTKIQIGIPTNSSTSNTLEIVKAGLSIVLNNTSTSGNVTTYQFKLSATETPETDISILLFGISEK